MPTDDRLPVRAVLGVLILAVVVFGLVGLAFNSTVHLSPAPVAKLVTSVSPAPSNAPTALPALPTLAPTPVPTAVPTQVTAPPVVKSIPKSVLPVSPIHNRLIGPGFNVVVSTYSDCSGLPSAQLQPLPRGIADVDTCVHWEMYFLGHNPGVFTPLFSATIGEIFTWYDSVGHVHSFRIVGHSDQNGGGALHKVGFAAEFETCIDPAGVHVRVLHAVLA